MVVVLLGYLLNKLSIVAIFLTFLNLKNSSEKKYLPETLKVGQNDNINMTTMTTKRKHKYLVLGNFILATNKWKST